MDWKREIESLHSWSFGDNPEMADELANETAAGKNLANCFLWSPQSTLPEIGERSCVVNSKALPICVVEVGYVAKMRFCDVSEDFAKLEGYKTLEEWRAIHREFFCRRSSDFCDHSLVVCQVFKLLHVF